MDSFPILWMGRPSSAGGRGVDDEEEVRELLWSRRAWVPEPRLQFSLCVACDIWNPTVLQKWAKRVA